MYSTIAGLATLPSDLITAVAPSVWSTSLKIVETTKDIIDATKTLLPTKPSSEKQISNLTANTGSALQQLLPNAPKTTEGAVLPPNLQEESHQSDEAKKKRVEEEKKRLEAERQKQEDRRKIDEQRRAQAAAEEALKKAKTEEEQGIAEEARKKAEQARIAAEQEAQKHQREEKQRKAQAAANRPPALSYSKKAGYESDAESPGVEPNRGVATWQTPFVFRVVYTDADKDRKSVV